MPDEAVVLCGASHYEKKFYLNPAFSALPDQVKKELQIMCVLFTEEVGGVLMLQFNDEGDLEFVTSAQEDDALYDEIGSGLKVKELQREKMELLESLELFYRTFGM